MSTEVASAQAPAASNGGQSALTTVTEPVAAAAPVTPPPASPFPEGDWRNSLPDDIKSDPSLKTIHTPEALAKSYIHAQKMVGADKIPLPGKHASEDDWAKFYAKIGVPPVEEYQVELPKEAKFLNEDLVKDLKPVAQKLGIAPKQLQGLLNHYEERNGNMYKVQMEQRDAQVKEQLGGLKTEWGQVHDQRMGYAHRVAKEIGGDKFMEHLDKTGLGNDVNLIRILATVGEKLYKEDTPPNARSNGSTKYDPSTALQRAQEIIADRTHPYHDPEHVKHRSAVAEVTGLYDMAYSNSAS